MDSSSQISDLIFSNKTVQSTLKALIQLFTLHLCVLGEVGTREGFIRPCCGWPAQPLGTLQGHWECLPIRVGTSTPRGSSQILWTCSVGLLHFNLLVHNRGVSWIGVWSSAGRFIALPQCKSESNTFL